VEIAFDQKVTASPHVLAKELQGEMVLLDLQSESYFGLDAVGTRIWQTVSTSPSLEHALGVLLDEYDVESDRLRKDMRVLVERLVEKGLLVLHEQ
jgi:hypothetical protein